jgi:hypothetical protein
MKNDRPYNFTLTNCQIEIIAAQANGRCSENAAWRNCHAALLPVIVIGVTVWENLAQGR